jgi:hypothetical protein
MGIRKMALGTLKWTGTVLCLLLVVAFLYSTRRAVDWTGDDLSSVGLVLGAVSYAWIRPDADLTTMTYPPEPGWSVALYGDSPSGDSPPLTWWIDTRTPPWWQRVAIPLWMPFVVVVVPTAVLWYRDRRSLARAWARVVRWVTPREPRKLTLLRVFGACVLHGMLAIVVSIGGAMLFSFFVDPLNKSFSARVARETLDYTGLTLVLGTPAWGVLWAWLFTRWQNRLFRGLPGARCDRCGYDLTGNVSGRCPECGAVA